MAHTIIYIEVGWRCSQDFADLCNTAKNAESENCIRCLPYTGVEICSAEAMSI